MTALNRDQVLALQIELNAQGYGPLTADGQYGPATAAAYRAYLDHLDPATPSLIPPPERPWWAKPALLSGAASVLVALAGFAGWTLDVNQLAEMLSALATLVAGALALYAGARGEAPLDRSQWAPGVRRVRLGPNPESEPGHECLPVPTDGPAPAGPATPSDDPRGAFHD